MAETPKTVMVDIGPILADQATAAVRDAARELLLNFVEWLLDGDDPGFTLSRTAGIKSRQERLVGEYLEEADRG